MSQNRTETNNLNVNSNKNLTKGNDSQALRKSSQVDELGQSHGYRLINNVYGQKSMQSSAAPNSQESTRNKKNQDSLTVFQRLASKMGESRRFLRSTDTQEEFRKVLRIINDANPDQLASFSGCSKLHEHVQSSVPYVLDDNFKMNPLNLKSVEAQVKYNDYLLRMGVIGSPTG